MADMVASIRSGRYENHIRAGCLATLMALAAEESMATGMPQEIGLPARMPG
jgi:hypothetical protein